MGSSSINSCELGKKIWLLLGVGVILVVRSCGVIIPCVMNDLVIDARVLVGVREMILSARDMNMDLAKADFSSIVLDSWMGSLMTLKCVGLKSVRGVVPIVFKLFNNSGAKSLWTKSPQTFLAGKWMSRIRELLMLRELSAFRTSFIGRRPFWGRYTNWYPDVTEGGVKIRWALSTGIIFLLRVGGLAAMVA